MRNFLTFIGRAQTKGKGVYQCVCGEYVEKRITDVKANRQVSCGCASKKKMNTGRQDDPLYNVFFRHGYNKLWSDFYAFRAELGIPDPEIENPWVVPIVPGSKIAPGNVRFGRPAEHFFDFSTSDLDMHHKKFLEDTNLHEYNKELFALDTDQVNSWKETLDSVRAYHRSLKSNDTEAWQKKIEESSSAFAIQERKRQEEKAISKGRSSQTQVGRLFRYKLVNCVAELLEENYKKAVIAGSGSNLAEVAPLIKRGLDFMTIAHITLTVVMDKLGRGSAFQSTLAKIYCEIGEKIDHQAFLNTVEAECPQEFDKISRWYLKNGEMGYIQKIRNSRVTVQDKVQYGFLSRKDKVLVGSWAFKAFASLTKWFDVHCVNNIDKHGHTKYLKLSEEGIKNRLILQQLADAVEFESWAMVHPPLDWDFREDEDGKTATKRGGYLLDHPGSVRKLIHNDHGTKPSESAIRAINKQQSIGFKVNQFIYDVQVLLMPKYHEIGAFKSYEAESWVDENRPAIDPSVWELPSGHKDYQKAKRALKRFYGEQKKAEKLHKNPFRVLRQAARFIDCDRFYFSCYFDARLRIYTHAVGLTYQGADYQKALLKFADGYEVTPENRERVRREMLVSIANTYGNDKVSFDERVSFAESLVKDLAYVAKDPLTTQSMVIWAQSADEPFQFLALLREYYEVFEWKTKTHTDVPGGRDATNSGNQILGAMCRDEKTCYYTNVITEWNGLTADKPQDLYGVVADGVKTYLKLDNWVEGRLEVYRKQAKKRADKEDRVIDSNLSFALNPNLVNIITRSHVKRAVMIDAYGGCWSSKNEHISDELSDTAKELDLNISLAEKRLVTDACILSQASSFPLSDQLNKWFKEVGKTALESDLELIEWKTPDGSHIIQEYLEPNIIKVDTYAMGGGTYERAMQPNALRAESKADKKKSKTKADNRSCVNIKDGYTREVMTGKTQTALGANFTHSHDASIIRGAMNEIETPFFGIHDCMYGPHGTLEDACNKLRASFYKVCSGDALKGLVDANKLDMGLPPKGSADINVCFNSPYMFS